MKRMLLISFMLACLGFRFVGANPIPLAEIYSVRSFPPEIGVLFHESFDISNDTIYTSDGIAIIDSGVVSSYEEVLYFDSSNTSGFIINCESGYVIADFEVEEVGGSWGNLYYTPPPIRGHYIVSTYYAPNHNHDFGNNILSFDFSFLDYGITDVLINEINAHGTWADGSGFIELYNLSDNAVSLAGWQVVCDTIYDLPSDAVLPAYGFYVIDEDDFPDNFDMDFDTDNIYLINPIPAWIYDGARLVDQVGWSSDHGENVSFMRYPEGDVDTTNWMRDFKGYNESTSYTFEDGFPTRGAPNRHESPGFVVIGTAADSVDESIARIHWTDPIWDELFEYSLLVKSLESYPETPADGDVIYQGTGQEFVDETIVPETPNYYTVFARNAGGDFSTPTDESRTFVYYTSVGVDEQPLPEKYTVMTCYPNPFNSSITISFSLEHQMHIKISIYDITGRLVEVLAEDSYSSGKHSIIWDAGELPSGVYFANLKTTDVSITEKLVLLK